MIANNSPTLYALLVGINEYASPDINNLRGCLNDVNAIEQLIHDKFKVPPENICKLLNEQATHQAIKTAFKEHLIAYAQAWAQAGKLGTPPAFLFHYSGHGSRAKDETHTKPGGKDETIVPHDSRTEGVFDIKDWELGQFIDKLSQYGGDNITVILDCCHSGSGTRGNHQKTSMVTIRRCPPDERPQPTKNPSAKKPTRTISHSAWIPTEKHVLLAACRNIEKANEYQVPERKTDYLYGAMTYFLVKELAQLPPAQIITYRELHERVRYQVNKRYKKQTPQCEGDRDRQILGGLRPARDVWLSVIEKSEDYIWIDGGIAHGLSENCQLQVYPPETRTLTEAGEPIARLSVAEVGAVRSACVPEAGNFSIPIHARAVVYRLNQTHLQRSVFLDIADETLRTALQNRLSRPEISPYVKLVEPDKVSNFGIRLVNKKLEIQDSNQHLLVAPFEANPNKLSELSQDLIHLIRYHNTLDLRNTANHSKLAGAISITVKQLDSDPDTQQAIVKSITPTSSGNIEIESGQGIVLEVTNHANIPLYFSALYFDDDWSITQLYPSKGCHEQLVSGQKFCYGLNLSKPLTKILPPEIPKARNVVKVIATVADAEFELLEQKALKTPFTPRRATVYRGKTASALNPLFMEQTISASAHDEWITAQFDFHWVQR